MFYFEWHPMTHLPSKFSWVEVCFVLICFLINGSSVEVTCNHLFQLLMQSLILLYRIPNRCYPALGEHIQWLRHTFLESSKCKWWVWWKENRLCFHHTWIQIPVGSLWTSDNSRKKKQKQTSLDVKSTSTNLTFLKNKEKAKLLHVEC